jgi:uncharacterized membrane protein
MISVSALTALVMFALLLTCLTPLILIALVVRDWKQNKLW